MRPRERRRTTMRALRRLQQLVSECEQAPDRDTAGAAIAGALVEVLGLDDCWYEPKTGGDVLPELGVDGELSLRVQRRNADGIVLPSAVSLPAPSGARFVLVGDPDVGVTPEQRLVAVLMAGILAMAPAADPSRPSRPG